jgi:hypothetical protein
MGRRYTARVNSWEDGDVNAVSLWEFVIWLRRTLVTEGGDRSSDEVNMMARHLAAGAFVAGLRNVTACPHPVPATTKPTKDRIDFHGKQEDVRNRTCRQVSPGVRLNCR